MAVPILVFGLVAQIVPIGLAIFAIVHIVRNGSEWWWIPVVLIFPFLGPIAYFAVNGGFARKGGVVGQLGARRAARRNIAALESRLQHASLPGLEAELGDELVLLGRHAEAEKHYRAALERLPDRLDIGYGLALALLATGRAPEALQPLEDVVAKDPRFKFGDAQLRLAHCLQETGQSERAEAVLRELLNRSNIAEAQVRLAVLVASRGQRQESIELASSLLRDAKAWPHYLRRKNRRWVSLARKLAVGRRVTIPSAVTLLRPPRVKGWMLASTGAAAAVVLLLLARTLLPYIGAASFARAGREYQAARELLFELNDTFPIDRDALTPERLARYIRIREALAPAMANLEAARHTTEVRPGGDPRRLGLVFAPTSLSTSLLRAHNAFLNETQKVLASERCSVDELRAIGALADWQFLRRSGAEAFALSYRDWLALSAARSTLSTVGSSAALGAGGRGYLEAARADVASIEATLAAIPALSSAQLVLLEAERPALARLPVEGLPSLAFLLEIPSHVMLDEMPIGE
jgi:hypothetical protein